MTQGYRALAHGEIIRDDDEYQHVADNSWCSVVPSAEPLIGEPWGEGLRTFRRKVRTEGCPPGWRWADAGERDATLWCFVDGSSDSARGQVPAEDAPVRRNKLEWVKPYPEDQCPSSVTSNIVAKSDDLRSK